MVSAVQILGNWVFLARSFLVFCIEDFVLLSKIEQLGERNRNERRVGS